MDASFNIITSNIRFDNPADGLHTWANRRDLLASILNVHSPAILATQEGRLPQIEDLANLLPKLSLVANHRQWIKERMYPCIFIDTNQIEVLDSGDIWLSTTPNIPGSISFGSSFPRLCCWTRVRRHTEQLLIINTHLDHTDPIIRLNQANVLTQEILKLKKENDFIVLLGDFNDHPTSEVRDHFIKKLLIQDPWMHPESSSHHPFSGENPAGARIDWILLSDTSRVNQIFYDTTSLGSIWPSDHFPVVCKIKA